MEISGGPEEEEVVLWTSEERNRWKIKRIMLHNQAVYFLHGMVNTRKDAEMHL